MEPSSGADPDHPPYKGRVTAARDGVRSAGFEPAVTWISARPVYQLRHEHKEPPPGADPGHPPYEGGAAAVRGGKLPTVDSNHDRWSQGPASCR
jgi:hypothetical protein